MKYVGLIILLINISNYLYGMDKNSNYPGLYHPSAPSFSVLETIKDLHPDLYQYASKYNLFPLIQTEKDPNTAVLILCEQLLLKIETLEAEKQKILGTSIVQKSTGTGNCTQTISNCYVGGRLTQINLRNATATSASNITINNSHTQKIFSYFKSSYTIPLSGLLCAGFLWWYLK